MKRSLDVTGSRAGGQKEDPDAVPDHDEPPPDRARQEDAFIRAVYQKHGMAMLRTASGLLGGDTHRAEDIVQEAVLRAWRHAAILDAEAEGVRPWLLKVVRNLVIDNHRARLARPQETGDAGLAYAPSTETAEPLLAKKVVLDALQSLSPLHREILFHLQYMDRSLADTAESLGIPIGTVKSRSHLALRALREALLKRGYSV
ncbi:sigma-70 family RNA polymerase sigma factor [Streptomyces antibioticus]|uniref:sigma-70 family RNA polymerase sigma factor n=1 Tax=Streptomyces antibioticus TaxID=1890 RepID=UPI0036D78133